MSNFNLKPDNNLIWAILSTFFCCLPLGIIAIVNASKVDGLWRSGEYEAAREAAANSKKYAKWSALAGVVLFVIVFAVEFAIIWNEHSSNDNIDDNPIEYVDSVAVDDEVAEDISTELSVTDLRDAIEEDVRNSNRDCPMEADNGVIITNIKMSGDYIVYKAECDEDVVSISSLNLNNKSIKRAIIESLREEADYVESLKKCDVGVVYKYVGKTSGDVCTIKIESREL